MNINEFIRKAKHNWKAIGVFITIVCLLIFAVKQILKMLLNFILLKPFIGISLLFALILSCTMIYAARTGQLDLVFDRKVGLAKIQSPDEESILYSYKYLRTILYEIMQKPDLQRLTHILAINAITDLTANPKTTRDGGFILYHYSLLGEGKIDVNLIKKLLQQKINLYLQTEGVSDDIGIRKWIRYNGILYPPIIVHKVVDRGNNCISVTLVIGSEEYIASRYVSTQLLSENEGKNIYDEDF